MAVILLGYRGSGKTSVGRKLAAASKTDFADSDERIVKTAGQTIREIFAEVGEEGFREREATTIKSLIDERVGVISLGGGAVLKDENRALLINSSYRRVYLRCDAEELHRRIHADPSTAASRPALTHLGGGIEEIRSLLADREPMYLKVATDVIDVTSMNIEQVVAKIMIS